MKPHQCGLVGRWRLLSGLSVFLCALFLYGLDVLQVS